MANWRNGISLDFGALAVDAILCPTGDVGSHAGPHKLGCHGLSGPFHAWVPKAVDDVEDSFAPCLRNKRSGWAVSDIYNDVAISNVNLLEVESRPSLMLVLFQTIVDCDKPVVPSARGSYAISLLVLYGSLTSSKG